MERRGGSWSTSGLHQSNGRVHVPSRTDPSERSPDADPVNYTGAVHPVGYAAEADQHARDHRDTHGDPDQGDVELDHLPAPDLQRRRLKEKTTKRTVVAFGTQMWVKKMHPNGSRAYYLFRQ